MLPLVRAQVPMSLHDRLADQQYQGAGAGAGADGGAAGAGGGSAISAADRDWAWATVNEIIVSPRPAGKDDSSSTGNAVNVPKLPLRPRVRLKLPVAAKAKDAWRFPDSVWGRYKQVRAFSCNDWWKWWWWYSSSNSCSSSGSSSSCVVVVDTCVCCTSERMHSRIVSHPRTHRSYWTSRLRQIGGCLSRRYGRRSKPQKWRRPIRSCCYKKIKK